MLLRIARLAAGCAAMMSLAAGTSYAQDTLRGIAFAHSPAKVGKQATGFCIGDNPEKAMTCAREKCAAGGAALNSCARVAWCYPMGWSAAILISTKDGTQSHEYLCGWDSRETLELAILAKCDKDFRKQVEQCGPVSYWDPTGKELPPS